jgi:hypothetical protein
MRLLTISRRAVALASAMLALIVILAIGSSSPAYAVCNGAVVQVSVLGQVVNACVPASSLPTVTVTLPAVTRTVTLPRLPQATTTVTKIVRPPALTVPGSTATLVKPGTTSTVTVTKTASGQTGPVGATITPSTVTSTVTATKTVTTPSQTEKETVTVTKVKALGISLLLVLIGALLAIVLLRAAYTYGWIRGDDGNRKFIREVTEDLRYKD